MKLNIFRTDYDELVFTLATTEDIALGDYSEVPRETAERWLSVQAAYEELQVEADSWLMAHPTLDQEPEIEIAGIEPIYTDQFEG